MQEAKKEVASLEAQIAATEAILSTLKAQIKKEEGAIAEPDSKLSRRIEQFQKKSADLRGEALEDNNSLLKNALASRVEVSITRIARDSARRSSPRRAHFFSTCSICSVVSGSKETRIGKRSALSALRGLPCR